MRCYEIYIFSSSPTIVDDLHMEGSYAKDPIFQ